MSTRIVCIIACFSIAIAAFAEDPFTYHKASIYSVMLKHGTQEYSDEIVEVFKNIPVQDYFYDMNLANVVFNAGQLEESDSTKTNAQKPHIDKILHDNAIGRRLVAKWFNRDKNGCFNIDNILNKGYYNVSASDVKMALQSYKRQDGIIYNAGEELIGNTFILVNDIMYGDKRKDKEKRMTAALAAGTALSAIPLVGSLALPIGAYLAHDYSGFNVTVTSYLYRLDWTDEIANSFYSSYYCEEYDAEKKNAFSRDKDLFTLSYIGCQTVHTSNSNFKGINDRETQIRLVCTRAIDKAIAQLQKEHPEFRTRTPLLSTSPITAQIGIREDITPESRFEVLEVSEDEHGIMSYKRVAVIKPKKDKIWDNRFMAEFEDKNLYNLGATEFDLVSGKISQAACLIREID